jgi:hypothetical protein
MRYHIELTATVPADSIKDEDEAAAERERLRDPEYVEQLVLDGNIEFTATLVATGDDSPVSLVPEANDAE